MQFDKTYRQAREILDKIRNRAAGEKVLYCVQSGGYFYCKSPSLPILKKKAVQIVQGLLEGKTPQNPFLPLPPNKLH